MDIYKFLKDSLDARDVAKKYLGNPIKISSDKLWYKSPFRTEKTASFMVSKTHMYDFGSATKYSIIDFCKDLWGKDIYTTAKVLAQDFGININNNLSNEEIKEIKRKQEERLKLQKAKKDWFVITWGTLTDLYRNTKEKIQKSSIDTLDLDTCLLQNKLERILDTDTDLQKFGGFGISSKDELYQRYGKLNFKDKSNILKNVDIIYNDLIGRDLNLIEIEIEDEEEVL